jgi:hypothetical protein
VGGVPERPGWSHVATVAFHFTVDVKCICCPEELRRTTVPVPARQASGVASRSAIDVKCTHRADCPGELRGMDVPVPTRKAGGIASHSAPDVGLVPTRRRGDAFDPRQPRLDEKIIANNNKCHFAIMLISL